MILTIQVNKMDIHPRQPTVEVQTMLHHIPVKIMVHHPMIILHRICQMEVVRTIDHPMIVLIE